ncbi:hypothetical protein LTR27_001557 [Elasticomyces elasticus]|nr:hypothetical protein LTR27_001557 [Elasticomyces elasticus]
MAHFFAPVIEKIYEGIDDQLQHLGDDRTISAMIMPGGFGRSEYLHELLKTRYPRIATYPHQSDHVGSYQSVARGAFARFRNIQERGLSAGETFAVTEAQTYDPNKHHDCNNPPGPPGQNTVPDYAKVGPDPINSDILNVYERFMPLKHIQTAPDGKITRQLWQHGYVYVSDASIFRQQIYWTKGDIQPSSPILTSGKFIDDQAAVMRHDVERYGAPLEFQLPNLAVMGFKQKTAGGRKIYEFYYRLTMEAEGANVDVKFQIAKPGSVIYQDVGELNAAGAVLDDGDLCNIVSPFFNPTVRTDPN